MESFLLPKFLLKTDAEILKTNFDRVNRPYHWKPGISLSLVVRKINVPKCPSVTQYWFLILNGYQIVACGNVICYFFLQE